MSEPYDPYVSGTSGGGDARTGGSSQNPKIAEIQAQIDDTRNVMQENIRSMQQRGETLESLQDKTENLSVSAQGFRRGANKVRKQMWWKDMKMRIAIIAGIVIIVLLIVLPIVFKK